MFVCQGASRRAAPDSRKHSVTYGIAARRRSRTCRRARRPARASASAPRRGALRTRSAELTSARSVVPPEQLRVGERRALDRAVEPALVDALRRRGDAARAKVAPADDRVAELRRPTRSRVVPGVPDERHPAAGPQHPRDLAQRGRWSNQWNACATVTTSADSVGERHRLAAPVSGGCRRDGRAKLREHLRERLDGRHAVAERDERARQLPGPGGQVDDVARRPSPRASAPRPPG